MKNAHLPIHIHFENLGITSMLVNCTVNFSLSTKTLDLHVQNGATSVDIYVVTFEA